MWLALRRLIAANPMGIFLWGLIAKWYVMIAVASLVVLFWVVKGLEKTKFLDAMETATKEIFTITKGAAQNCIPKLGPTFTDLTNFWDCLGDPPAYDKDKPAYDKDQGEIKTHEEELEKDFNKILPKDKT